MSRRRSSRQTDALPFDTMTLEGGLFVPALLEKASRGEAAHQTEADYGIPKGLKLHEEYGRAYRIALAQWQVFAARMLREDLDPAESTRQFVIGFLRDALGYSDIEEISAPVRADEAVDRAFPVSAMALGGRIPLVIAPHDLGPEDPDPRFAIGGGWARRKSPFQLAQEFLNASPHAL